MMLCIKGGASPMDWAIAMAGHKLEGVCGFIVEADARTMKQTATLVFHAHHDSIEACLPFGDVVFEHDGKRYRIVEDEG